MHSYDLNQIQLMLQQLIISTHPMQNELVKLLAQSDAMTEDLISLRNSVLNNNVSQQYDKPSAMIVDATKHRTLLRTLAETLEANRNLVQINKQKIEKSRIVLEGLDYFKKTLKDKIQGYHTDVESIEEYLQEPLGEIDWQNDYESGERKLKQSLEKLKTKDQLYKSTIDHKNELAKKIYDKNKLYNSTLSKQVKKLNEHVLQTSKLFGIQTNQLLQKIQNQQLAYIFDSMKTLRKVEKIDVFYGKQQHEYIDLVIKPVGLELYERALQYKIKIEQKEVKLKISYLKPEFCKLVIGVDRRSDFSNKDIFHRLINREQCKVVFDEPSNQTQRNINNKYVYVEWVQDILCASSVQNAQFLAIVRNRVFITALSKYIFDNIRSPGWISNISPLVHNEITHRKLSIEADHKINFNEYKLLVNIPLSIKKSLNNFEQQQRKQVPNQKQLEFHQQLRKQKNKLLQILSKNGLEELLVPQIYQYHKLTVHYSGMKVQCIVIMPYQYPQSAPKIKLISIDRAADSEHNTANLSSVERKAKIDNTISSSQQSELLQRQANAPFTMLNEGENEPFRLLYYLSKLLHSLTSLQQAHIERKKMLK